MMKRVGTILILIGVLIFIVALSFYSLDSERAVDIYLKLLIAVFGFIAPVVSLAFPIFDEGFVKAQIKYDEEIKKKEKELKERLPKQNLPEIKNEIDKITREKKVYESRLDLFNIKKQIKRLFVPLIGATIFLHVFFQVDDIFCIGHMFWVLLGCLVVSKAFLIYSMWVIWELVGAIVEAKREIDKAKKINQEDLKNLLTEILDNISSLLTTEKARSQNHNEITKLLRELIEVADIYVPNDKIHVVIDDKEIYTKGEFRISVPLNVQQALSVDLVNRSQTMLKKIEVGFRFDTKNISVQNSSDYRITNTKDGCVVRFDVEYVQHNTLEQMKSIMITGRTVGKYDVKVFVKGESIRGSIDRTIIIDVFDATGKTITQEIKK